MQVHGAWDGLVPDSQAVDVCGAVEEEPVILLPSLVLWFVYDLYV